MKVRWDIRREGRAWAEGEAMERWELTPERLEMFEGKLLWDDESRIALLALLLENLGVDRAVCLGDPAVWVEAVEGLQLEGAVVAVPPADDHDVPSGAERLPADRRTCAALLGRLMSDLSEDYWAAGWLIDLEFELWQAVTGGKAWITAAEVARLRYFSGKCGGWIVFNDGPPYRRYVPLAEWLNAYDAWCSRRAGE